MECGACQEVGVVTMPTTQLSSALMVSKGLNLLVVLACDDGIELQCILIVVLCIGISLSYMYMQALILILNFYSLSKLLPEFIY